jgi:hypothetical protein
MTRTSGYERVVDNIANLPETKAFIKEAVERFQSPKVLNLINFDMANYSEREAGGRVTGVFTVQYGPDVLVENDVDLDATDYWRESVRDEAFSFSIINQRSIYNFTRSFIEEIWGTERCKTYNCKNLDRVNEELHNEITRNIRSGLPDDFMSVARNTVISQIQAFKALPEWKDAQQKFLKDRSKQAIIRALKEFPDVSDDVFHEALHEFISERVVDD